MASTRRFPQDQQITASAPCRIDSGGTWDIKSMALPFERIRPVSVNIALDLRTTVTLRPFEKGKVKVYSEGFPEPEIAPFDRMAFNGPYGLFFAAVAYFGLHGLEIHIRAEAPLKSALGGSSTALVALVHALSRVSSTPDRKRQSARDFLYLAYQIEDAAAGGNCGVQDHAAAAFGGVHLWQWRYSNRRSPFAATRLLNRKGQRELSKHLAVAHSGESHISADINRQWLQEFSSARTRDGWIRANGIVHRFSSALSQKDWGLAAELLQREMEVRKALTPDALTDLTGKLVEQAASEGCGARFAGAGGGGAVWALGDSGAIERVRTLWGETLAPIDGAGLLDCGVDPNGVG